MVAAMQQVSFRRVWLFGLAVAAVAAVPTIAVVSASEAATPTYKATITRTEHGIPHIVAKDWGSLGFGSGYAAAETTICTLADTVLTGRGERSKYLGPKATYDDQVAMSGTNLQVDALVTDIHNRQVVEKLLADPLAGPGSQARKMVAGYAEGVNQWLRDIGGAGHITDPACKGEAWIKPNATALDLWYGVYLANLIASSGHFLKEIVEADPPSLNDPGLPLSLGDAVFSQLPDIPLDVSKLLVSKLPFGSNATAVGKSATTTGSGMILGNPHFPWRGRYRFTQQHLTIPGEYDVAGGSLVGSPVVNIGWNKNVAWSHTVSTAYRFTPYEYMTAVLPTKYVYDNKLKDLDHRIVHIQAKKDDGSLETLTEDMYRTPEGYVIDAPGQFMGWTPLSFWAIRDANGEQLRTIDSFLNMGKASNVHDLLARQDAGGGIPWVNTIAADRKGDVLYADHSVVPNVSNALANSCMTVIGRVLQQVAGLPGMDGNRASTSCRWGTDADAERPGIFGPKNLPAAFRTDWVMNANDSYWLPNPKQKLEGYARIIGCEKCQRTMRTRMVDHYVIDQLKKGKISPQTLRGFEHQNRVWAAEAMGTNADLVEVCVKAEGSMTDACNALANWDRHSNIGSRGYALFEAFATRLPQPSLPITVGPDPNWKVQFSASDPVDTPRDLDESKSGIVDAMKSAIASLRDKNIAMNATWGSLQVAGDTGAPPIPLGGGEGDDTGNANALASRNPVANTDHFKPVTYGSSHIEAISFLPDGKVDTKTILTYGQSENPKRAIISSDQTKLFSEKKWVSFPWTTSQIADQKTSSKTVTSNG
jgi:acyl-homoserine-lactone acylase